MTAKIIINSKIANLLKLFILFLLNFKNINIKIKQEVSNMDAAKPILLIITYIIQINVAINKKHIIAFTPIVQDPDVGNNLTELGNNIRAKYGKAKPIEMVKNIIKITIELCDKAKEIEVPKNGAEQGVASKTAKIPERKLAINILFSLSFLVIFLSKLEIIAELKLISKYPSKLAINIVNISAIIIKK